MPKLSDFIRNIERIADASERQATALETIAAWVTGSDDEEVAALTAQLKTSGDALRAAEDAVPPTS